MLWIVILVLGAVVCFALGWPRDALAGDQAARGGLLWGALTFVVPGTVGFIAGWVAQTQNETSEVAFGLVFIFGGASSFVAIVLGTLTARVSRGRHQFRGHS